MKFVLKNTIHDDLYYAGDLCDAYGSETGRWTDNLNEAVVYNASLPERGQGQDGLFVIPELPRTDVQDISAPVAIRLSKIEVV